MSQGQAPGPVETKHQWSATRRINAAELRDLERRLSASSETGGPTRISAVAHDAGERIEADEGSRERFEAAFPPDTEIAAMVMHAERWDAAYCAVGVDGGEAGDCSTPSS